MPEETSSAQPLKSGCIGSNTKPELQSLGGFNPVCSERGPYEVSEGIYPGQEQRKSGWTNRGSARKVFKASIGFYDGMELKSFKFHSHFFGPRVTQLDDGADVAEGFSCDTYLSTVPDEEI